MAQIEIVQYEGENPREKRKGEEPQKSGKTILVWRFLNQVFNPPPYDADTQRLSLNGYTINGDNWEATYVVSDLLQQEIAIRQQQAYLSSLNWQAFEERLIDISEGTPYRQLSEWAKLESRFVDSKANISYAITRQNEKFLQQAIADLKQQTTLTPNFTAAQLTEIDDCLQILGVNWLWAQL